MKKIIIIIAAVFALYSCEDATDIVQPSEFGFDAAFQNAQDVKTAVYGVYGAVNSTSEIQFATQVTDECSLGSAGNNGSDTHRLQINVNNGFANAIWANNYAAILRANILFEGAALVTPTEPADVALYNEALGENYALRAYAYSKLLTHFAEDLNDPNSLGVILIDFVPSVETRLPRSSVQDVVDFINNDLQEAENLLTTAGTGYSPIFVSVDFVRALRARVNAYVGDYGTATTYANAVLGNFTLPTTASEADFRTIWQDVAGAAEANEVIFKFDNTLAVGSSMGQIWNTNLSDATGSPLYEVSRNLYQTLEDNSTNFGDIRRNIWIDPSSTIVADYPNDPNPQQNDRIVVDKYPGDPALPGLTGGLTNDQKVFRTVEMHFILAEAAVVNGDLPGAAAQIKTVRDARYTNQQAAPVYASAQAAWADILNERKIELFAEGHRFADVKRLGALANQGYDRNETDCSLYPTPECDLGFSDVRTQYLPIPAAEFQGNPGIQQNPNF
ncbi:RagB/SusD family nutrient uptake outer membrane protein [Nonlabens ulvanivorans]|uniref:RagB/SusD family nutrient uptake outer membrane protein n=1 Tax=Nonlabens ulvanivorans TaxID=906888 RepID=UPI00055A2BA8|nr:RagB/SusD family nutrient uptake outer membrane protein [Nonlabens ulvanivorans]